MANMFDFYFRQLVTEGEVDAALDALEAADRSIIEDQALSGLILGGNVIENSPTQNLTVNVEGPLLGYDQLGRRVAFLSSTQNVNVAVDENGAPTAVTPASGNEKVVSIFVEFDRFLTDPREDGNNQTVFYNRAEGFQLNVVQGAEYTPPAMPALPALRSDQLLLADITLTDGMSQIFNADIDSITRREDAYRLTGTPFSSTQGQLKDVLQDVADELNTIQNAVPADEDRKIPAIIAQDAYVGSVTYALNRRVIDAASADTRISVPLVGLKTEHVIKSATANLVKVDGTTANATLIVQLDDGTVTASNTQTNSGTGQQSILLDAAFDGAFFPYTVAADESLFMQINTLTIGDRYFSVNVLIDGSSL